MVFDFAPHYDPDIANRLVANTLYAWRKSAERQLSVASRQAFVSAYRELGNTLPSDIQTLCKAMDLSLIPKGRVKSANQKVAEEARVAIATGWKSRLPRNSPGYRSGERLVGKLGEALDKSSMTAFTTDRRVSFINRDVLNQEAVHWYRVNYGARGANLLEGKQPQTFTVMVQGRPMFSLRDPSEPAAHSYLPPGFGGFFWRDASGVRIPSGPPDPEHVFVPRRRGIGYGAGVRAARFTDLGLEVVAKRLGPVYFQMMEDYAKTRAGEVKFAKHDLRIVGDLRDARFSTAKTLFLL